MELKAKGAIAELKSSTAEIEQKVLGTMAELKTASAQLDRARDALEREKKALAEREQALLQRMCVGISVWSGACKGHAFLCAVCRDGISQLATVIHGRCR